MLTNIDIDDALLADAARLTGLPTKKAIVEEALRRLVRQKGQAEALRELTSAKDARKAQLEAHEGDIFGVHA